MQVVFGTMSAESKSVRFNNTPLIENYIKKQVIAYLPQCDLLPPFISFENALTLYELDDRKIFDEFPELEECLKRKSSEVSGGQRRLFEVLLVLYSNSRFVFWMNPFPD